MHKTPGALPSLSPGTEPRIVPSAGAQGPPPLRASPPGPGVTQDSPGLPEWGGAAICAPNPRVRSPAQPLPPSAHPARSLTRSALRCQKHQAEPREGAAHPARLFRAAGGGGGGRRRGRNCRDRFLPARPGPAPPGTSPSASPGPAGRCYVIVACVPRAPHGLAATLRGGVTILELLCASTSQSQYRPSRCLLAQAHHYVLQPLGRLHEPTPMSPRFSSTNTNPP